MSILEFNFALGLDWAADPGNTADWAAEPAGTTWGNEPTADTTWN
jgi:hypothetical protein